jgi:hypothetical protein
VARAPVAAVDARVAAADAVERQGEDTMKTTNAMYPRAAALALAAALGAASPAGAQAPFATPQSAANTLIEAIATHDGEAISRLLGQDYRKLLPIGEVDPDDVTTFLQKSSQVRNVKVDGGSALLSVGNDPWTLPIPIVQGKDGQWRFDTAGGRAMLLEKRIGANERAAIQASLAFVDAQRDYAQVDRNGDGVLEYAQKLVSTPGKRNGLIWSTALGDESPLGEAFVPKKPGEGYYGYHFRILTAQGPQAKGGARSFLIGNRMTAGFALIAWPVKYGETGVMTFITGSDGAVYESDLGPGTSQAAAAIKAFNPDTSWKPAQP